ncbi:MAG: hemerythrin domain-containing protein [Bdellovibrionales bacterium]
MLIYEALKKDHQKVQALVDRLVNLKEGESEQRSTLISQIRDELVPHARAEEAVFYNSIRAINTAQDLIWDGYREHVEAEALLRTLQAADKINADFRAAAVRLQSALKHHIAEEEGRMFSVAQQLFTEQEARAMAEAFEEMKPEVREAGIMQNTLDAVANMLPQRLAEPLRHFTTQPH